MQSYLSLSDYPASTRPAVRNLIASSLTMPQRLIRLFHRSGSPSKTSRPSPGVKNAELEGSFPRTLGDLRCLRHAVLPIEASQTPPMPTDSVSSARLVPSTLQGSSCQSVGTDDAHKPKNIEQNCSSAVIGFEGSEELIISGETPQELESCDDLQAASTVKEPSPPYEEPLDDPLDGDLVAALAGFLARLPVAEHERTLSYPTEEHLDAEYGGHVQRTYVSIEGLMKHSAHVLGKRCCRDISIMG